MTTREDRKIPVDVIYASPARQKLCSVLLDEGATIADAIAESGLCCEFPEIDLQVNAVGIFGRLCELSAGLKPNDRVEIYRDLILDPKTQRRLRAGNKRPESAVQRLKREK